MKKKKLSDLEKLHRLKVRLRRRGRKHGVPDCLMLAKSVDSAVFKQPLLVPEISDEELAVVDAKIGPKTLTFFKQKRPDGSIRTGIELDDELVLSRDTAGFKNTDFALVWYIHVQCLMLPSVRSWDPAAFLAENAIAIKAALMATAKEIKSGIFDKLLRHDVTDLTDGSKIEVAYFTTRRASEKGLRQAMVDLASRWVEIITELNGATDRTNDQAYEARLDALIDEGIASKHYPLTGALWEGVWKRGAARARKRARARAVHDWFNNPNQVFGGQTPKQLLEQGETQSLLRMLYELESGEPG